MKKLQILITSAFAAFALPGCLQNETTVHLNKDGSGKLVEETRLGAQMVAMMSQFSGIGGEAQADPLAEMFSEDKAKARAKELGEGVAFEKSEPVNAGGSKGARVTYSFKDINQLKVAAGDGMKSMNPAGDEGAKNNPPIAFSYSDGNLTIKMPEPEKPDAPAKEAVERPELDDPQAMAMMKQMLGDMKISLKLVIEPGIAETNATHQDANTITLMEMNMGKLAENEDNLKKLGTIDQNDPTAAMEALKGIDGVKIETKREVTVKVK